MAITGGITRNCATACAGGAKNIWVANSQDIDQSGYVFGVDGSVTSLTMVGLAVFYKLELQKNTKQFTENTGVNGCSYSVAQAITGIAQCNDQDIRNFIIEAAKQSCCGITVIMEMNDGTVWIWGHIDQQEAFLGDGTAWDSGTAVTDANQVTINLQCNTTIDGKATTYTPGVAGIPV